MEPIEPTQPHSTTTPATVPTNTPGTDTGTVDASTAEKFGGDGSWREQAEGADGRRRRRQALAVVLVALLAAGGGVVVGTRLKSPADEAAARQAPPASRITVEIRKQVMTSTLSFSGEVRYDQPTDIKLTGAVGLEDGKTAALTAGVEQNTQVNDGDKLIEVSSRPVFVIQGTTSLYREMTIGTVGPDVQQLEEALKRLGHDPGPVDQTFDAATAAAVTAFYTSRGFQPHGPSKTQKDELKTAQDAVTAAQKALKQAKAAGKSDDKSAASTRLQLTQAVQQAEAAVPNAQATANRAIASADLALRNANTQYNEAVAAHTEAQNKLNAAKSASPADAEQIAALTEALKNAGQTRLEAEKSALEAKNAAEAARQQATVDVKAATDALALARTQYNEGTKAPNRTDNKEAVAEAQKAVAEAQKAVAEKQQAMNIRVPSGEFLVVAKLPTTVTQFSGKIGTAVEGSLGQMSSSETQVVGQVKKSDSSKLAEGTKVKIEIRDFNITMDGTVASVAAPAANTQGGEGGGEGGGYPGAVSGQSNRLEAKIKPDDPAGLKQYLYSSAKVTVDLKSTDGEVMAVPLAAVRTNADGNTYVIVEVEPITADSQGSTKNVTVETGISAGGLMQITSDELKDTDRIVVGMESNKRKNADDATTPSSSDGEGGNGNGNDGPGGGDNWPGDDNWPPSGGDDKWPPSGETPGPGGWPEDSGNGTDNSGPGPGPGNPGPDPGNPGETPPSTPTDAPAATTPPSTP